MTLCSRDHDIDTLRAVGLLLIILAHVGSPDYIFQLRNFDVPLMVLVSGFSMSCTSARSINLSYYSYLKKRVARIYIPVLVFFVIYFPTIYILSKLTNHSFPYDIKSVVGAFFLTDLFPYVWIFRIFITVAMLVYPFVRIVDTCQTKKNAFYVTLAFIAYILSWKYILTLDLSFEIFGNDHSLASFLGSYLYCPIGYAIIFILGYVSHKINPRKMTGLALVFFCIFFSMAVYLYSQTHDIHKLSTQSDKYPPGIYYLSYALFMSFLLSAAVKFVRQGQKADHRLVRFIGKKSMEIYLWHIFFLFVLSRTPGVRTSWLFLYVAVTGGSIAATYLQGVVILKARTMALSCHK